MLGHELAPVFFFVCRRLECLPWTDAAKAKKSAKAPDVARGPISRFLILTNREDTEKNYTFMRVKSLANL